MIKLFQMTPLSMDKWLVQQYMIAVVLLMPTPGVYQPPAKRIAPTVKTQGKFTGPLAQVDALTFTSTYTTGLSVKSWTNVVTINIYNLSWGKTETCDTTKWADANACNGVGNPWGYGTI